MWKSFRERTILGRLLSVHIQMVWFRPCHGRLRAAFNVKWDFHLGEDAISRCLCDKLYNDAWVDSFHPRLHDDSLMHSKVFRRCLPFSYYLFSDVLSHYMILSGCEGFHCKYKNRIVDRGESFINDPYLSCNNKHCLFAFIDVSMPCVYQSALNQIAFHRELCCCSLWSFVGGEPFRKKLSHWMKYDKSYTNV